MKNLFIIAIAILFSITCSLFAQNNNSESDKHLTFEWLALEKLPVDNGQYISLPYWGLFIEDGKTFYSLDSIRCPKFVKFRMKHHFDFEQTVISEGDMLVKSHNYVMRIHKDETSIAAQLDTEAFFLQEGTGTKYHLVVLETDNTWGWYTCDWESGKMECVTRSQTPISHIFDNGTAAICIIENGIYIVTEEKFEKLQEMEESILDGVETSYGLFLCTAHTLYFYDTGNPPKALLQGDFHSLHYDGEVLYIVLRDGRILKTTL